MNSRVYFVKHELTRKRAQQLRLFFQRAPYSPGITFDYCLVLIVALQFAALQSLLIHPHPCSLAFALFLFDLITIVYICRAAPCFSSLTACLCFSDCLPCLSLRPRSCPCQPAHPVGHVGPGRSASCLKSNQARTRLLACSS